MVLVVIAHVQRYSIDWSIITECFLVEIISIMLLNPASTHRMQADGKQKREYEIEESSPAKEVNDRYIVCARAHEVDGKPAVPHLNRL